jgi:hypothetical protein
MFVIPSAARNLLLPRARCHVKTPPRPALSEAEGLPDNPFSRLVNRTLNGRDPARARGRTDPRSTQVSHQPRVRALFNVSRSPWLLGHGDLENCPVIGRSETARTRQAVEISLRIEGQVSRSAPVGSPREAIEDRQVALRIKFENRSTTERSSRSSAPVEVASCIPD